MADISFEEFKCIRAEHLRKLNMALRRDLVEAVLVPLGITRRLTDAEIDAEWDELAPFIRIERRPNPNYRPPTMDGCDERGMPL